MKTPHNKTSLWQHESPLLLASGSKARRALLEGAGIPLVTYSPAVDERLIEAGLVVRGAGAATVARRLASAKAIAAGSHASAGQIILGADQTLSLGDQLFHKAADVTELVIQLSSLSGKTHILHSAISVFRDGTEIYSVVTNAALTMRELSMAFINGYISMAGVGIYDCVGGYQLEGLGIHLFDRVEGDHPTILGLPLYPLLKFFRSSGYLEA